MAVDGTTSRRSGDGSEGTSPIHTVSAYLGWAGAVLSAAQVKDKESEIVTIPHAALLVEVERERTIVTTGKTACATAHWPSATMARGTARGTRPPL
jgi:hypothetical protein